MIRVMTFAGEELGVLLADLPRVGRAGGIWIDARQPDAEQVAALRAALTLNDFAVEDALEKGHWSRYERYPEHHFLVMRTFAEPADPGSRTERVSMFWTPDVLLTITNEEIDYLERVRVERHARPMARPEELVYDLLEYAVDTFFGYADAIQERTDELEERLFDGQARGDLVRSVFDLKHHLLGARRLASALREATGGLVRHEAGEDAVRFRDVLSNLTRVYDTLDSSREVLSSVLDVHLSVQSNRLNRVMRTLAAVSVIFLPLTFLAGVWGMNFEFMPELEWRYGYVMAWAVLLTVGITLALYFRRRGWW